jgi:UDP-N-acetylmuramyl pentapeptide phosphotransferase/UDP-N-acetylglucosamine-1-phosphate transferase
MTDRDLLVLVLALVVAAVIGALDVLLDLDPEGNDGLVTAALVATVAFGFYRLGNR